MNAINKYSQFVFILFHIVSSLDFGYVLSSSSPKIKYRLKLLTAVHCLSVCAFSLKTCLSVHRTYDFVKLWDASLTMQYFLLSFTLLLSGDDRSYHSFQKTLKSIDLQLFAPEISRKVDLKVLVSLLFSAVFKLLILTSFCVAIRDCSVYSYHFATYITMLSQDIVLVISFFVFYSTFCRLSVFNKFLQNGGKQVQDSLKIYVRIVDAVGKSKECFDYLYFILLIFKIPDLILSCYYDLIKLKSFSLKDYPMHYVTRSMYVAENFALLSLPAMSAGMLSEAVDELRLIVHERLLIERDQSHVIELEYMLDYINARPMKFSVFKIVPLDWTLPVLFFHLCLTYQIIIVQLTQLY